MILPQTALTIFKKDYLFTITIRYKLGKIEPINIYDLATTFLHPLGTTIPSNMIGKPPDFI